MAIQFFNKYPYTDFHELNADFILQRLKDIEEYLENITTEIEGDLKIWLEEQLQPYKRELQDLIDEVNDLKDETEDKLDEFQHTIDAFIVTVNNAIAGIRAELIASIQAVNDLTDVKIENNNLWLLNEITENVGSLFLVLNPFTGEEVTIQNMVDYLAQFHMNNAIDYDTMASRAKTYNQFNALNITYTDLAVNGNTLYV